MSTREQWSVADVAAYLGVKSRTVTAYLSRGQMPPADGKVGRSPWSRAGPNIARRSWVTTTGIYAA